MADLREYVFNQTREDAEKTERTIEYPYLTKHKIVVVGGHETFLKAIIPKLPNVRFIHRDELEDASVIRNADVVWFQTNSVPHKQFYRVIDTARKHHIPVRYLAYASAEKCAEQIVTEDER